MIETDLMKLIEMKFAASMFAAEMQIYAAKFEKMMAVAAMQTDSDDISQTEMKLIAPFVETMMIALTVWRFRKLLKKITLI